MKFLKGLLSLIVLVLVIGGAAAGVGWVWMQDALNRDGPLTEDVVFHVEPGEGMHVYAPGADKNGYRVIGFNMAPSQFVRYESVEYPESEIYHFAPLDEDVDVYQEPFTIMQDVVMAASAEIEEELAGVDAITLSGTLDYQACDDAICYLPVSVPVSFTLEFQNLDYVRSQTR